MVNIITMEQIDEIMQKHGRKASKLLNYLSQNAEYVEALSSELGRIVIGDVLVKAEQLLDRIIKLEATQEEIIKYKVCKELSEEWAKRVSVFMRKERELAELVNQKGE